MCNALSLSITDPIPLLGMPEVQGLVLPSNEPLVNVLESHPSAFVLDLRYVKDNLPGAVDCCLLREQVANRLYRVASLLPSGYKLKIFDAWRPLSVQRALYEPYFELVKNDPANASLSEDELKKRAAFFVSYPSEDPQNAFVHSTGGSVDLTIVDSNGNELDMGTEFDDFSGRAYTSCFEKSSNETVKQNRRLLYHTMLAAGFTNLPSEWWHYDYGNKFWGYYKQQPAMYEGVIK